MLGIDGDEVGNISRADRANRDAADDMVVRALRRGPTGQNRERPYALNCFK